MMVVQMSAFRNQGRSKEGRVSLGLRNQLTIPLGGPCFIVSLSTAWLREGGGSTRLHVEYSCRKDSKGGADWQWVKDPKSKWLLSRGGIDRSLIMGQRIVKCDWGRIRNIGGRGLTTTVDKPRMFENKLITQLKILLSRKTHLKIC